MKALRRRAAGILGSALACAGGGGYDAEDGRRVVDAIIDAVLAELNERRAG